LGGKGTLAALVKNVMKEEERVESKKEIMITITVV
jgi:hypothetical protein